MASVRPTVLLFDVDGTLVTTPGAGRRALGRGFARRWGRADALASVSFGGMTDRAIVRAGLAAVGEAASEALIDAVIAEYLPALEDELAAAVGFGVHRGVLDVLDALARVPGVAVGVGTGNVRAGAGVKLRWAGIEDRFAFGGYGCDHEERAEILRAGARRGAARLGATPGACRVVVIGDTPRDVAAALAVGAEAIGVGTCGYSPEALRASGATHAFPDLAQVAVVDVLLGLNAARRGR
jgi:phosphoglycolate phosphatase-like HAD superfamily hydrolase